MKDCLSATIKNVFIYTCLNMYGNCITLTFNYFLFGHLKTLTCVSTLKVKLPSGESEREEQRENSNLSGRAA